MPIDPSSTTSSQDAFVRFEQDEKPEEMADKINAALQLISDDAQRSTSRQDRLRDAPYLLPASGYEVMCPEQGTATVVAISKVATTGSDGSNYHTIRLLRNGVAANTITAETRYKELPLYLGGVSVGQVTVNPKDWLSLSLSTTGSPTSLAITDLLIQVTVTPNVSLVVAR